MLSFLIELAPIVAQQFKLDAFSVNWCFLELKIGVLQNDKNSSLFLIASQGQTHLKALLSNDFKWRSSFQLDNNKQFSRQEFANYFQSKSKLMTFIFGLRNVVQSGTC